MGWGSIGNIAKKLATGAASGANYVKKKTPGAALYLITGPVIKRKIDRDRKKYMSKAGSTSKYAAKRKKMQKRDYKQARHETKRKATQKKDYRTARSESPVKNKKKQYKGMKGMKYTQMNKSITSIADRMQARRRRR